MLLLCAMCVPCASVQCALYGANNTLNVKGNVPALCFCCLLCVYHVLAYTVLCAVYGATNITLNVKVMSQLCAFAVCYVYTVC